MNPACRNLLMFPLLLVTMATVLNTGCAEGPLWKTGYLSPWARQQWAEEEQIASTLFSKKDRIRQLVEQAAGGGSEAQESASEYLSKIVANDPIMLLRIEAVRVLPQFKTETSVQALQLATRDRDVEVRRAAVRAWEQFGGEQAQQALAQMAQKDSDIDVQISATAALGSFKDAGVVGALSKIIKHPNPSLQLRAAESLASVTGQEFGADIQAWQAYLLENSPATTEAAVTRTADAETSDGYPRFK